MATNLSETSIFNPSVKDVTVPFFLGLPKAISDQKNYGTALSEGLKGAAEVGTDVVKVAHTLTQQTLDDSIHAKIDAVRDPYNYQLSQALDAARGNAQTPAAGGTVTRTDVTGKPIGPRGSLDLLSQPDPAQMPAGLDNLTENLTSLGGARANGKLSRTDYSARLDALAKDFRADYPGWREYIDKKFESITGENPANALIKERIADINTFVGAAKAERDKIINAGMTAIHEGVPDAAERLEIFKATGNTQAYLRFLNQSNAHKYAKALADAKFTETKDTIADKQMQAEQVVAKNIIQPMISAHIGSILESAGVSSDPKAQQKAFDNMDPATSQNLAQNMRARAKWMEAEMRRKINAPIPGDPSGNSYGFYLKAEGTNKLIEDNMKPIYATADYLTNKETGLAGLQARLTQSWLEGTAYRIGGTPGFGEFMREAKVVETAIGPQAMSTVMTKLITDDLPTQWNNYSNARKIGAAAGTIDPATGKMRYLVDDVIEAHKRVKEDDTIPEAQKPKLTAEINQQFIQQIQSIADPDTPIALKQKYIERAFSEEGKGLLAQIERDGIGPTGKKGKFSVYNELTDRRMTDAVKALGGKHWELYKNWAESTWSNELLKPEVRALTADINSSAGKDIGKLDIQLTWNDKAHTFGATFGVLGQPTRGAVERDIVNRVVQDRIEDTIVRLNGTLSKYAYIAKTEGLDVNTYVAKALLQIIGQNPTEPTAQAFIDAIHMTTRPIPKPVKPTTP